jgi:antitoxin CcdA
MVVRASAKRKKPARPRRKTPTNLSLREDLVRRAKALNLNLSEVVESALEQAIVDVERSNWLAENEQAIDAYNAFVEKHGVFGDTRRQF